MNNIKDINVLMKESTISSYSRDRYDDIAQHIDKNLENIEIINSDVVNAHKDISIMNRISEGLLSAKPEDIIYFYHGGNKQIDGMVEMIESGSFHETSNKSIPTLSVAPWGSTYWNSGGGIKIGIPRRLVQLHGDSYNSDAVILLLKSDGQENLVGVALKDISFKDFDTKVVYYPNITNAYKDFNEAIVDKLGLIDELLHSDKQQQKERLPLDYEVIVNQQAANWLVS